MVDARFFRNIAGASGRIAFLMKDLASSSFDTFFTIHCSLFTVHLFGGKGILNIWINQMVNDLF